MDSKSLIQEIRSMLKFNDAPESVEMASAVLTDGTVIKWEGELAVGTAILVETAEGDIPAPDGTHEVEGGMLVTTVGGVVTEVVEPSPEVEVEASQEFATIEEVKKFFEKEKFEADLVSLGKVVKFMFNDMYGYRIKQDQIENELQTLAPLVSAFEKIEKSQNSISEAFSKTVDLVERVANLPSAEPTKAPEALSKKEQQFANIVKLAQQLKNK